MPAKRKELLVGPHLPDFAFVHHDDLVADWMVESRWAMTMEVRPCEQLADGVLNEQFCLRVHAGCCFIKDQDSGMIRQGPGKGDQLLLSDGQRSPPLFHFGMVLPREILDEPVCPDNAVPRS